ncbi:hypothetical protein MKW98_013452 [Papaver atlanticum]|uniref:Uncharacterized protein n=1 Tax=Papaver atlanticum TaxID=357466 RepID=A0AAD4SUI6_9MAGN|nr:hypothetical protein MKW98_013452 [Papaver atlanticum]
MADGAAVAVLLETAINLLIAEAVFLSGVKEQIEQLKRDLKWMLLEVGEAFENKSDKRSRLYANQMRDIAIDAHDVIEKFIDIKRHGILSLTSHLISRHRLGNRVAEINASVEKLRLRKTTYNSTESSNRGSPSWSQINKRRAEIVEDIKNQQEPAVNIYENSEMQVIDLLTGADKSLCIISIVGMGGVGKTTLSLKVFKDDIVKKQFECRAFVHISNEYTSANLQEVLQTILVSCGGSVDSNKKVTCETVKTHLQNRKYLIVLDDIWDTDTWKELKGAFPEAQNGSRVLLTTRHKYVAVEAAGTSSDHELFVINDIKKSWELFQENYAPFKRSSITYEGPCFPPADLVKLGNTMLEKCHGLPLAIVVLGGLLSYEECLYRAQPEWSLWSSENDRSSWISSQGKHSHKCSGILALSYDYLPDYLKPCFLYMSLFPENSMIRVTKLFQYWIAEEFIIQSKSGGQMLEDTAMDYLNELISRSLIQVSKLRCDGKVKNCHIHGLLHGISASESTTDDFSEAYDSVREFNQKENSSRRVIVYCKEKKQQNERYLSTSHNSRIRSLMCHEDVYFPTNPYLSSFFSGFKSLRVLDFYGDTGIVSLPKAVKELIHLRYLSLEKSKLEMINTSYLSKLVHLRTLNLRGNEHVQLDDQIWLLVHMRHLYLRDIRPAANNGRHEGIGTYPKELQLLVIQAGDWIYDCRLQKLSSLRKLKIEECLNMHLDEISIAVANLTKLRSLGLICKTSIDEPITNEQVPLASIPFSNHTSLVSLHLKGHILDWPTYITSFPPHLCKLKLEWSWITEDPMLVLEKLPSLKFLRLGFETYTGMKMVCSKGGFVSLQTLELDSILSLEEWELNKGALESLTKLTICGCENLKMIPDGLKHVITLKELTVTNMPHLRRRMAKKLGRDWHKIKHIPSEGIHIG